MSLFSLGANLSFYGKLCGKLFKNRIGKHQIRTFLNLITDSKEFTSRKNNDINNRCFGQMRPTLSSVRI